MKDKILIIILIFLIWSATVWWIGYYVGYKAQIEENIKYNVMNKNGTWKQKFWLAKDFVKHSNKQQRKK